MDERKKILELVASGQLSIDEGDRILDALDQASAGPADPKPFREPETFTGESLYHAITDVVKESMRGAGVGLKSGIGVFATGRPRRGRDIDEIVRFASHGVSPGYVRDMRGIFDEDLSPDELTDLMNHGVNVEYAREMRDVFADELSPDEVRELMDHGVRVDYAREMRDIFEDELSADEIRELMDHGVRVEFVREMIDAESTDLEVDEVIRRRDEG